jgi:transmembrane sensor
MKNKTDKQFSDAEKQAVEWFLALQSDTHLSETQLIDYANWLKESPEHEDLIARCESSWNLMGLLEDDPEFSAYTHEHLPISESYLSSMTHWSRYAVASLAVLLISLSLIYFDFLPTDELSDNVTYYQTVTGQQQIVNLKDGSVVTLNTATELHIDYSKNTRHVFLERGEALFEVAHNPERLFTVYAGAGEVRALGTKFNVRVRDKQVIVALLEGKVEVETESHNKINTDKVTQTLFPGEQTRFTSQGEITRVEKIDPQLVTQWKNRNLSFTDMPLHEVVEEINRYTTMKLVVADPAIVNKRLSAYFYIDNVDSFLSAIEELFDIKSTQQAGKILLSQSESHNQ